MAFPWNEHWIQELRKLSADGLTAKAIAAALTEACGVEVSRNAIIGKINRLGLAMPTKSSVTRLERNEDARAEAMAAAKARREQELAIQAAGENNVHILGLERSHCRYPVAGEGIDTIFCGEKRAGGSYCEYHHGICSEGKPAYKPKHARQGWQQRKRAYGAQGVG